MANKTFNRLFERGFTLIEVMVALAIVSGLVVVLITSANYHIDVLHRQETRLILTSLAKDRLDVLKVTKQSEKGEFQEPFRWASYHMEMRDSLYPGVKELVVRVKGRGEEVVISELVSG